MRPIILITRKSLALGIVIAGLLAVSQSVARADELTITGTTAGVLTAPPTLLYNSARINGTTNGGLFVLDALVVTSDNLNNLGSFTLSAQPTDFEGAFTLYVTINLPSPILGGNTRIFPASLFLLQDGSLLIDIDNAPQLFAFSNASGSGVFSLTVDDLLFVFGPFASELQSAVASTLVNRVNCPSFPCTGALTGTIAVVTEPIPEPATLLLLATGVSGLAAGVRRRRDQG